MHCFPNAFSGMLSSFVQDGSFCSDNSDQCAPWAVYNMFLGYYGLLTTYWCVLLLYRTIHIPNFSFLFNFNMYFNAYYLVYSEDLSEVVNHGPLSPLLILPGKRLLSNLTEAWYTWDEWKILLPAEQRASALAFVVDGGLWHHNV